MNDYFSAKTILSMLQTEEEIKKYVHEHVLDIANGEVRNWGGKDLFVHVCALYATKFRKECIDIIDVIDDESDRMDLFRAYIESFEWRSAGKRFWRGTKRGTETIFLHECAGACCR